MSYRVNTIHRLPIVATLMSPDAIKNTLLPFLDNMTKKEGDEIVFAIAEEYANIAYNLLITKSFIEQSAYLSIAVLVKPMHPRLNSSSGKSSQVYH